MGYDLYGMNPQNNTVEPAILTKFNNEDGWVQWDKMTKTDKKIHFEAKDKYENDNPGEYFRANVWYWRPIWNFVCTACDDFMTDKDMDAGCSNSGDIICKTKAIRIAQRLNKLEKQGIIKEWEDAMLIPFNKAQKNNEKVRSEMAAFQKLMKKKHGDDIIPAKYPKEDYVEWEKLYAKEDWAGSYPPSRESIIRFGNFCRQSGGFQVC